MSNSLKRLNKGEVVNSIDADTWNAFCRTTEIVSRMQGRGNGPGGTSSVPHVIAEIENTTGDLIDAEFPILAMGEPIYTFTDNEEAIRDVPRFKGETPTATTSTADIAIVQGPIADGEMRAAIIQGPANCEVDVTDEAHTHAKPKADDNTQLASGTDGFKIRWKESGTGTKKAVVILGGGGGGSLDLQFGYTTGLGTAATTYALDDAGTVQFQPVDDDGNPDGEEVTLKIRYADTIPANTPGFALRGQWIGLNFGCNQLTPEPE